MAEKAYITISWPLNESPGLCIHKVYFLYGACKHLPPKFLLLCPDGPIPLLLFVLRQPAMSWKTHIERKKVTVGSAFIETVRIALIEYYLITNQTMSSVDFCLAFWHWANRMLQPHHLLCWWLAFTFRKKSFVSFVLRRYVLSSVLPYSNVTVYVIQKIARAPCTSWNNDNSTKKKLNNPRVQSNS